MRTCAACGNSPAKRCPCLLVSFCSKECQRRVWNVHKTRCMEEQQRRREAKIARGAAEESATGERDPTASIAKATAVPEKTSNAEPLEQGKAGGAGTAEAKKVIAQGGTSKKSNARRQRKSRKKSRKKKKNKTKTVSKVDERPNVDDFAGSLLLSAERLREQFVVCDDEAECERLRNAAKAARGERCSLCNEPFPFMMHGVVPLQCGHMFHKLCMQKYVSELKDQDALPMVVIDSKFVKPRYKCPSCGEWEMMNIGDVDAEQHPMFLPFYKNSGSELVKMALGYIFQQITHGDGSVEDELLFIKEREFAAARSFQRDGWLKALDKELKAFADAMSTDGYLNYKSMINVITNTLVIHMAQDGLEYSDADQVQMLIAKWLSTLFMEEPY